MIDRRGAEGRRVTTREEFQTLAARIHAARQFQKVYPPGHPSVENAMEDCFKDVLGMLGRNPKIQIAYTDGEFVVGNRQVPPTGEVLREFAATLEAAGVARLVFLDGLRQWELQRFLKIIAMEPDELASRGGIQKVLDDEGVQHIEAGGLRLGRTGAELDSDMLFRAWEAYTVGLNVVRTLRLQARETGWLGSTEELRRFAYELVYLAMQETRPLLAAHALKAHDEYSFTHSVNVAMLTVAMARALEFTNAQLEEIAVAALLHDIGKERIPAQILQKPGKLTEDEWKIVNRHGVEGASMLAAAPGVGDLAPIVAFEHHLSYHGELPDFGKWQTHVVSQIVSLADVYDALRSVRPYRDELPPDVAMNIMAEDVGTKFDPDLFQGFSHQLGYYPPGTCVRLAGGAVGLSYIADHRDAKRPHVLMLVDAEGLRLDPPEPVSLVDLVAEADGENPYDVAEVVDPATFDINPLEYL